VTEEEFVDGFVPFAGVLVKGAAVPPVIVEFTVGEASKFRKCVANALVIKKK
jgi:hypothetical protein